MPADDIGLNKRKYYKIRPARIIACLLFALALLAMPSCAKEPGGAEESAPSQDASRKGEADDGDGERGGGGGEPDDADEADDMFATTSAADLSPELRTQIDAFCEKASLLPLDDVPSAAALLAAYRGLAFEGPVNDALFFTYEEYMQFVCEGLNSVYEEEPPDEDVINNAIENGFIYVGDDDYYPYFILRPDFLKDTFAETVSAKTQAFLNLLVKHYEFRNGYDFIQNEKLMVSLDRLAEMIVDWENYIIVYPDVANRSDIEVNLDYYLKIYIGSIQIENTGLYSLAGTDESGETLYKLMDEPKQSYLRFIENYPDSAACPLIAELYQVYADNDFLYSVKVEDFFRTYGLAYDL